jgi:AcrR family transcriptional regulator
MAKASAISVERNTISRITSMDQLTATAPTSSRRERRRREVRERIIDASLRLFIERGCELTTVEEICERADVARKTFYNYFASKHHLINYLSDTLIFDKSRQLLAAACAHSPLTIRRLSFYIDHTSANLREFAAVERVLIRYVMQDVAFDQQRAAHQWNHMSDMLSALIAEGQEHGDVLKGFNARFLGELVAGAIQNVTVSWIYDEDYPTAQRLAELKDFLALALRPEPTAEPPPL